MAYFVEVCLRCCARVAFPNRHTNPAFSPLAFLCQTRQTNPDERLLEKCCFDMTATPSCYCHESAWHVSNDVATSATQLFFLFPYNLTHFLISKLSIFLYFSSLFSTPVFHLSFLPLIAVLLSPHKLLISPPRLPHTLLLQNILLLLLLFWFNPHQGLAKRARAPIQLQLDRDRL